MGLLLAVIMTSCTLAILLSDSKCRPANEVLTAKNKHVARSTDVVIDLERQLGPEVTKLVGKPSRTKRDFPESNFYNLTLQKSDIIYYHKFGGWDTAPIVVPEYKLVFFTIPKVGCSEFKKLFRGIMGIKDWRSDNHTILHNPKFNGLWYLYDYSPQDANTIMTDPSWTRAMFVRDPRKRLVSAYLDKAVRSHGVFLQRQCCGRFALNGNSELETALNCSGYRANQEPNDKRTPITLNEFLQQFIPACDDEHWRPQRLRVEERYWPFMNFVGHMERAELDAKRLLQRVGAWEKFGTSGWGKGDGDQDDGIPMFGVNRASHATNSSAKEALLDSPGTKEAIDNIYQLDYSCPLLGLDIPEDYTIQSKQTAG